MDRHLLTCPQCGYSLQGLPADYRCPECGYGFQEQARVELGAAFLDDRLAAYLVSQWLAAAVLFELCALLFVVNFVSQVLAVLLAGVGIWCTAQCRTWLIAVVTLIVAASAAGTFWGLSPRSGIVTLAVMLVYSLARLFMTARWLPYASELLLDYERAEYLRLRGLTQWTYAAVFAAGLIFLVQIL